MTSREQKATPFCEAASKYGKRGWAVFPLEGKRPFRRSRGFKDATTDPKKIEKWKKQYPHANIGVRTGAVSGLVVVDVDGKEGEAALAELGLDQSVTLKSWTGRGYHLWYAHPGEEVKNRAGLRAKLDIRGDGGYVVAPPSIHPDTKEEYRWDDWDIDVAPLPQQILDLITAPRQDESHETKEPGIIHEGQRNSALASLGGAMRRKGASEQLVCDALHLHNKKKCKPPLSNREVDSIVRSVTRYPSVATTSWHLTDVGNARALVAVHGSDLKYVPGLGWFEWDGCRWNTDDTGAVVRSAKALVDSMLAHSIAIPDEANRVKAVKWTLSSQSVGRIAAMVKLAESEEAAVLRSDRLDSDPWLFNVRNGTLDLRTGELREHRRDDLLTRLAHVEYDTSAQCPKWEGFLDRVMAGNRDLISYLQRAVGYSLTGSTDEQCFFLFYGTGANGKSTFLETMVSLIGQGQYATAMNFSTLTNRQRQEPSEDIARLRGIRMVTAIESGRGKVLNETLVKQITGSDTIAARLLYKGTFTFRPVFKLFLAANYKPRINDDDYAIWRRVKLVPFEVQIPESDRQRDLQDRLRKELSGILNWAIEGCAKWRAHGLGDATAVREATAQYRRGQGALPEFLHQECERGRRCWVESRKLFERYEEWCAREERNGMTETAFGKELRRMGFPKDRKGPNRTTRRLGVRMKDEPL